MPDLQRLLYADRPGYTPALIVQNCPERTEVWNKYTYYEHAWNTISSLTGKLQVEDYPDYIDIFVSPVQPDYEKLSEGAEKPVTYMKRYVGIQPKLVITPCIYSKGRQVKDIVVV